ncbi:outer membrane-specific lipoprotein transporter subunit LolC [Pirellulimonas nuda]|uniref:Outer membrane-specific lipoprotein transporter subunit LolC n=1 Tax=Pirellulimonas nuda TaxID=2528009 RepID=A0A518DCK4_9BACT|nr:ABC transporter permease [Pirellulimonas nuda]QDU89193.1 outer membrane-specific lipoprotein transporter subunit LolC [Pirellulimonas nuda]
MIKFFPYVVKSMWRHRARTLLTVSGTAVAMLVFCFIGAVQQGMLALTQGEDAGGTLIVFQENRFCPQSSRLPQDYAGAIEKLPGVAGVTPVKVFTNNCRASLDAIVFQGMPPDDLRQARDLTLRQGDWGAFAGQDDAALVGVDIAARRGLSVGDKFTIGGVSVVVRGVFESGIAAQNNLIYTQLEFLQRARGADDVGTVTMFEVRLQEGADADRLAKLIDQEFHNGPVGTTTRTKGVFQADTLADLAELIGFVHWLGYACVGLVLSLVATTTVMAVQDRIKEHAVLQTLGLRPGRVFGLVMTESVLLSTIGGLLGAVGGLLLLGSTGMSIAAEGVTIAFEPSPVLAAQGVLVALAVGVLAGIAPGWTAAQTQIVSALRHA